MRNFERKKTTTRDFKPDVLDKEIIDNLDYAAYSSIDTQNDDYDSNRTIAAMGKALGDKITRIFLTTDAETTLKTGAATLTSQASKKGKKDYQASLIANVVSQVAGKSANSPEDKVRTQEGLLKRCSLDKDFKQEVRKAIK